MRWLVSLFVCLLAAAPCWADAPTSQQEIVKATLISETTGIVPGQPFNVAIVIDPKEGWHTYWENPGDAGMTTALAWTLPEGFSAGGIDWPAPEKLVEGPLVTYSYPYKVTLPVTIATSGTLKEGDHIPVRV